MFLNKKTKWPILIVLGVSFLTLSLANACMAPEGAPKAADCCAVPCRNVSSPELAKSFCHLSAQQRSLHSGPQLPMPALLAEDGLALIADSLKAPPFVFSSRFNPDRPIRQSRGDLFILHRTLLL